MCATRPASPDSPLSARGGGLPEARCFQFPVGYIVRCLLVALFSSLGQLSFPHLSGRAWSGEGQAGRKHATKWTLFPSGIWIYSESSERFCAESTGSRPVVCRVVGHRSALRSTCQRGVQLLGSSIFSRLLWPLTVASVKACYVVCSKHVFYYRWLFMLKEAAGIVS